MPGIKNIAYICNEEESVFDNIVSGFTYVFRYVMLKDAFGRVQIWVFFRLGHWARKIWHKIVRGHLLQVNVAIRDNTDLRYTLIRCVLVSPVLHIPTELILRQIPQDSRQGGALEPTDARYGCLVALDEPLKVFNWLGTFSILDKVANFLLLDLGYGD